MDWNCRHTFLEKSNSCRLLRGGVDWNIGVECQTHFSQVASFAEAWIEIPIRIELWLAATASPPSRRRGLKYKNINRCRNEFWSPPSRRRGLKWLVPDERRQSRMSPPSRRRGLKSYFAWQSRTWQGRLLRGGVDWNCQTNFNNANNTVASFAEAWIEICTLYVWTPWDTVASFAEAWIEIKLAQDAINFSGVASFAEAWIEIK